MVRLVDGYAGFGGLASGKTGDAARLAFCWAHVRRRFGDIHVAARSRSDTFNRPSELDIGQSFSTNVKTATRHMAGWRGWDFARRCRCRRPGASRDRHSLGQQPA
jgi:hypothetical protein